MIDNTISADKTNPGGGKDENMSYLCFGIYIKGKKEML